MTEVWDCGDCIMFEFEIEDNMKKNKGRKSKKKPFEDLHKEECD